MSKGVNEVKQAYDVLVIGAGFAGAVAARSWPSAAGSRCFWWSGGLIWAATHTIAWMKRAFLIHQYGPHIFHTNNQRV